MAAGCPTCRELIYDVLARVPGFFPTTQATWKLVGSRGLLADGNDHILLLIDGHPQNSIISHGFQQQDQMPALEKVERIEIIRGPGSVLWGTSAAHAIINVVTKDAIPGEQTVHVSAGYGSGDGLWTVNLLKDLRMGDAEGVLSASYWEAEGYNTPQAPNVKFPWGAATNLWPRLDAQNPGFELYLKLKQGDSQQILARVAQTSVPYPWDSWSYDPAGGVRPWFHMAVDNFISWETKLDLGYRNMGEAYSHGAEVEGRYFLTDRLAVTGNYSLAQGYLRTIPTGVDINGVSQPLDGALTNANRAWLNYPMHMWNAGADFIFLERQSINANLRGWHTMQIVAPFNAPNAGEYDELPGQLYLDASYLAKDLVPKFDLRVTAANVLGNTEPVGMAINNGVFHPRGRSLGFQCSTRF